MYFSTFCPSKLPPAPPDPPPFPLGEGVLFYFFATLSRQPSTLDNKARALATDERVNWVFVRGIISLISLTYQSLTFRSSYVCIISIAPRATPLPPAYYRDKLEPYQRIPESLFTLPEDESFARKIRNSRPPDVIILSILLMRFGQLDSPQPLSFQYSVC